MTTYKVYCFTIVEDTDYLNVTHYVEAFVKPANLVAFLGYNRAEAYKVYTHFLGFVDAEDTEEGWGYARHFFDAK